MRTAALTPARIDFSGAVPRSLHAGDLYHARAGAAEQARHVFLNGNGLPGRWQGRRRFTVLETGFGLGQNFLATWCAWRDDPQRCGRLDYVALELHPPVREDLRRALAGCPWPDLASQLVEEWPPLLPGVHSLVFEGGYVRLHLVLGDARRTAPSLSGLVDAFYLDGFAPRLDPSPWEPALLRALGRRAAPGATLATWCVAREVRAGLREAGFEVGDAPGLAGRKRMTVARHPGPAGRADPSRPATGRSQLPPGRPGPAWEGERRAVIVGGGLAGAAVAAHLAAEGWQCTVLDRADTPAAGASGNPAGLFHGALHREDGAHARLHRAGALRAARSVAEAIHRGGVAGSVDGLRVLIAPDAEAPPPCPPDYAQVIAEDLPGEPPHPGRWIHYARGGWVDPGALVRWWLATPGVTWRSRCDVARLRRVQPGPEDIATGWELLDAQGSVLAQAPVVVLALGSGLGAWPGLEQPSRPPPWKGKPLWPITPVRGQVTWFASQDALAWPVSGQGYAVRLPTGEMLCGATSCPKDLDPAVREADHTHNLERLRALTGLAPPLGAALGGRVGWRAVTPDRLPLIGAVPRLAGASPTEQTRFVPREPGLFVVGGYGSRGLTWAALGGEILTAWLEGTPAPLEGDLLDAVDPARFAVRAWRRAARDAP